MHQELPIKKSIRTQQSTDSQEPSNGDLGATVGGFLRMNNKALEYHARGYSIMPVKRDKRPLLTSWKYLQTTHPTDEEVAKWFPENTKNNIGIITGAISSITVVDIDTKGGQEQADAMFSKFPTTYTIKTPSGGYHLYYQYHAGLSISANAYPDLPNVDIRSDGGFVVAPPSTTPTGEYKVINNAPIAPFPAHLFPTKKPKKTLTEMTTAKSGARNETLASFAGKLLKSTDESEWYSEVLPAVLRANKSYTPPLSDKEAEAVFNSIAKKERTRRENLATSPVIVDGKPTGELMNIQKSRSGLPFMNMANVVAILEAHPDFRNKIRYNLFRQEIEIDGVPIEDNDIIKIQYTLQTKFGLHSITKDAVFSALVHCAYGNSYDEAQDWLTALDWDGIPRLATWLPTATGVANDEYHRGIGTQWLMGMVNRIMIPGCIWDYMLVLVGSQGIGKSSLFRIIGGKWYKAFTGSVENKDFYLTLRGAILIDLDEGATLYKAEAIKIKSIITQTEDEFRAPYDRVPKKFPRRFVFSMSTNDPEPFRDATGNRRYWVLDMPDKMVDFKWLEENRDQLFAEAYFHFKNKTPLDEVPMDEAKQRQEMHLPDDVWTEMIADEVRKSVAYCQGSDEYSTTTHEVFAKVFPNESIMRLDRKVEMRITGIFKKELGLYKMQKMVNGKRANRWYITEEKKQQLRAKPITKTSVPFDDLF